MADHIQIGDIAPRIQYTGDGSQVQYTYPFPIFAAADMEVYLDQAKQESGFAVNGAGNSAGGNVTFDAAPASGVLVTLRRRLAIRRTSDFQESGEFRSKVINDELDYLTAGLQQVSDDGERALKLTATDPTAALSLPEKAARANMFLAFDAEGNAVASDASGPPGPMGPAGDMAGANNLSEITDPVAARSNLGLGAAAVEPVAAGGATGLLRADGDGSALTGIVVADDVARANIMLNAFRLAVQGGLSVQNMVDGVVDEFEDETGVDLAASTIGLYDQTGDMFLNHDLVLASSDYTGATGTATLTPAGHVKFNSQGAIYVGTHVITGDFDVSFTWTTKGSTTGSTGLCVGLVLASAIGSFSQANGDFGGITGANRKVGLQNTVNTIQAHGDGASEGTITVASGDVIRINRTGSTFKIYVNEVLARTMTATSSADLYLVAGAANAFADIVDDFAIASSVVDTTLISNAATALSQPTEAFLAVWQQDVDAVTLNTDLKAWASRDGGTTWTQAVLSEEANLGASGRILTGSADISAQPAGTSMKWKLETLNAKGMNLHGVGLEWS